MASSESDEYYTETEEEDDEDGEDEVTDYTEDDDDDENDDGEEEDGDDDEDSDSEYSLDEVYEYEDDDEEQDDDDDDDDDDEYDDALNHSEEQAVEVERIKGWSSDDEGDEAVPALEHGDQVIPDEISQDTDAPFSRQSTPDVSVRDLPSDQQTIGDLPTILDNTPLKGNPNVPSTDPAMSSTVEENVNAASLPSDFEKMKIDPTPPSPPV